jgi:hypothetical protein
LVEIREGRSKTMFVFKWTTSYAHQKINEKKYIFSFNLFKNEEFFKILKTNDVLNYLAKSVEQLVSKTHLDASENATKTFFS